MAQSPTTPESTSKALSSAEQKALTLAKFLQIEKQARQAITPESLGFIAVNETHRLIRYDQAVFWKRSANGKVSVQTVSGIAELSDETPYIHWLKKILAHQLQKDNASQTHEISREDVPGTEQNDWNEWIGNDALWVPFLDRDDQTWGGLLFIRASGNWQSGEKALLERIADAYSHAGLALEQASSKKPGTRFPTDTRRSRIIALIIVAVVMLIPVRQSALAPAEIIPLDPVIVTSPLEGVVSEVHVQPNSAVHKGELLFSLDDTTLRNKYQVALKAADVAQAEYLRAAQKAFKDEASKSELSMLRARVSLRQAEARYTKELLEKVDVHAERDGIAIFTAANDWLGKPVIVGEKVMTLADPAQAEMQLWLPVDDAISLESGAKVKLFLNTDPVHPLPGTLRETSYEPQVTAAGSLAFQLKASLDNPEEQPRIGLKGTGKIYGKRVLLISYLFRRPISALRRFTGF